MTERRKSFLINLGVGAVLAALVFAQGTARGYDFWRCVCDAFFVAAVMLLGVGGIRAAANQGIFDVAGYGLKYTVALVFPSIWGGEKENLIQYRDRRAAARKSPRGQLLAGAVYMALAVLTLGAYEML